MAQDWNDIEGVLRNLSKPEPRRLWLFMGRRRVLSRLGLLGLEAWMQALVRRVAQVMPSPHFVVLARVRLMERIAATAQRVSWGWALTRQLVASTLIMTLAVTSTLFFVDGRQVVNASEDSFVEAIIGEVQLKRASELAFHPVSGRVPVGPGDLLRTGNDGMATVTFFDDTQVRLDSSSTLLLDQLLSSPAYSRQGVIDVVLSEGRVWVQALNVNDGYAVLRVTTPPGTAETVGGSLDVRLLSPREADVTVYKANAQVNRQFLSLFDRASFGSGSFFTTSTDPAQRAEAWVQGNLLRDREHLERLRVAEIDLLQKTVGALPGDWTYPLKQARERLTLALASNEAASQQAKVDIANQRLSEALLLLESGQPEKAQEAIAAYQKVSQQIAATVGSNASYRAQANRQVLAGQRQVLVASAAALVDHALGETEALLAQSPEERFDIRFKDVQSRLSGLSDLATSGDFAALTAALQSLPSVTTEELLSQASLITDETRRQEAFGSVLLLQKETARRMAELASASAERADASLSALLMAASAGARNDFDRARVFVEPLAPALFASIETPAERRVRAFVEKIQIYRSWTGQKNQIERLLKNDGRTAEDIPFLAAVRDRLDARAADLVNSRILQITRQEEELTARSFRMKAARNKRLHDENMLKIGEQGI